MDIFAIGLAPVASQEPDAPTQAEPGFDEALAQVQNQSEGSPPIGPPGAEPPPGKSAAGEGVTKTEPNALSNKPDFLPLPEVDVEMPAPFWDGQSADTTEGVTDAETSDTDRPSDEAIELMMNQFAGGLFVEPQAVVAMPGSNEFEVEETPTISPTCPSPIDLNAAPTSEVQAPENDLVTSTDGNFETFVESAVEGVPQRAKNTPSTPETEPQDFVKTEESAKTVVVSAETTLNEDAGEFELTEEVARDLGLRTVEGAPQTTEFVPQEPQLEKATNSTLNAAEHNVKSSGTKDVNLDSKVAKAQSDTESNAGVNAEGTQNALTSERVEPKQPAESTQPKLVDTAEGKPLTQVESSSKNNSSEQGQTSANSEKGGTSLPKGENQGIKGEDVTVPTDTTKGKDTRPESEPRVSQSPATDTTSQVAVVANPEKPAPNNSVSTIKAAPLEAKEVNQVVKQVADRLQMLAAARPKNGVTVHLSPENFGTVTVVVKAIGRTVDTQLFASEDRVREALDQNQTRLTEAMNSRGFQLQSVSVSQQSNNSTSSQANRDWQNQTAQREGSASQQNSQNESGRQGNSNHSQRFVDQPESQGRWMSYAGGFDLAI